MHRYAVAIVALTTSCCSISTVTSFSLSSSPHDSLAHNHHRSSTTTTTTTTTTKTRCRSTALKVCSDPTEADDAYDVVVVGSGIGGLCAAAMSTLYGYKTAVFESHYAAGGCAHGFKARAKGIDGDFCFDTGPSFFSGLNPDIPAKASNPLRTVLDAMGERVECEKYETFGLKFPEGDFVHTADFGRKGGVLEAVSGYEARYQWTSLMKRMEPLENAVAAMPTAALRFDVGAALTAGQFLPNFAATNPLENLKLTRPFIDIVDSAGVVDKFTRNWLDLLVLLSFWTSGIWNDYGRNGSYDGRIL